jgi:hypothetical protein
MSARKYDLYKAKAYGNVAVKHVTQSGGDEIPIITKRVVRLHSTDVVTWDCTHGKVVLNSGGWQTVTTKTAINVAFKQMPGFMSYYLFQKKGNWFVVNGKTGWVHPFVDGMELESHG